MDNHFINTFATGQEYEAYIASEAAMFPNIAYVEATDSVYILDEAPESPYEMRFFDSHGDQIDTERYTFEVDIVYCLKLYDKDNEDYVATTDWSPEITPTPDLGKVEIEEEPKNNQYSFNVRYGGTDPDVNFKAIVDRAVVDEANYHFIVGL